jgi:dodecin
MLDWLEARNCAGATMLGAKRVSRVISLPLSTAFSSEAESPTAALRRSSLRSGSRVERDGEPDRTASLSRASSALQIGCFEVVETRGHVEDGKRAHYQVTIKIGFTLDDD